MKQSARLQTWGESKTAARFGIRVAGGYYPDGINYLKNDSGDRLADYYIFAWHDGKDQRVAEQWEFYIVPSTDLPKLQKSIGLSSIRHLTDVTVSSQLRKALHSIISTQQISDQTKRTN